MVNCEHLDVTKDGHCHIAKSVYQGHEQITHVCYECKRNKKAWEKYHSEDKFPMPNRDYYVARNVED